MSPAVKLVGKIPVWILISISNHISSRALCYDRMRTQELLSSQVKGKLCPNYGEHEPFRGGHEDGIQVLQALRPKLQKLHCC